MKYFLTNPHSASSLQPTYFIENQFFGQPQIHTRDVNYKSEAAQKVESFSTLLSQIFMKLSSFHHMNIISTCDTI